MVTGSNQRIHALSKNQIDIEIDGKSIKKVEEAKSLGLFIDEHLSWTKHIEEISKKISSAIGALKRIRQFISESTALQIYQALILPHFDYCSPVWDELVCMYVCKSLFIHGKPSVKLKLKTKTNYNCFI